jgi:hypothetical protein
MSAFTDRLKKYDNLYTGIITGLLLPFIVYLVTYYAEVKSVSTTLFSDLKIAANILPVLISHCIIPDLLVFMVFLGAGWGRAAMGILGSSVVLTVLLFLMKLIFSFM